MSNWILGELGGALNADGLPIHQSRIDSSALAELLDRIADGTISGKIAKDVFTDMWQGEGTADEIIEAKGLRQITDTSEIESIVDDVLAASEDQVRQYKEGSQKVFGYFVGQVMKASRGKANPKQVNELLRKKLD